VRLNRCELPDRCLGESHERYQGGGHGCVGTPARGAGQVTMRRDGACERSGRP
jgi:hypothetical protein